MHHTRDRDAALTRSTSISLSQPASTRQGELSWRSRLGPSRLPGADRSRRATASADAHGRRSAAEKRRSAREVRAQSLGARPRSWSSSLLDLRIRRARRGQNRRSDGRAPIALPPRPTVFGFLAGQFFFRTVNKFFRTVLTSEKTSSNLFASDKLHAQLPAGLR